MSMKLMAKISILGLIVICVHDFYFQAAFDVIREGSSLTGDLGGSASCSQFTDAIIRKIEEHWWNSALHLFEQKT